MKGDECDLDEMFLFLSRSGKTGIPLSELWKKSKQWNQEENNKNESVGDYKPIDFKELL